MMRHVYYKNKITQKYEELTEKLLQNKNPDVDTEGLLSVVHKGMIRFASACWTQLYTQPEAD